MGKTYRKVSAGSQSVDYHSPHNRGFAKKKKKNSHHQVRTKNRNLINEDDFIKSDNIPNKMKYHWAAKFMDDSNGNMPNTSWYNIVNIWEDKFFEHQKPEEMHKNTLLENLEELLEIIDPKWIFSSEYIKYIKDTIKQVKRRGVAKKFRGHRENY